MAHCGTLKGLRISETAEDIRGSHLYGVSDEKLGKIDDVIFDHSTGLIRYVVVDTGGWLKTKKFVVPADTLSASKKHENDFQAQLTKEQIEGFPPYNESELESESTWKDYEGRYRAKWETNPVMHRAETDRNITPTTQQIPGQSASAQTANRIHGGPVAMPSGSESRAEREADVAAASRPTERAMRPTADEVVIDSGATGIGGRWDTFQNRLRERRKEAIGGCRTCTNESPAKRNSESTDTLRKAV